MFHTPLNAFTWILGSAAMFTFGFKSWRSRQRTKNPLARIYFWITMTLGAAFLLFGLPALLTANTDILKYTYFLADVCVQLSMQAMVWLLWFVGLRERIRLWRLLIITSLFSLSLLVTQLFTSQVSLSVHPDLVVYADQWPVLIMKSVIYLTVALPLAYFLLRQVPAQASQRAKIKSLLAGLIFIVVSIAATYNNVFDKGSDTVGSTIVVAAIFAVFLVVAALPSDQSGS